MKNASCLHLEYLCPCLEFGAYTTEANEVSKVKKEDGDNALIPDISAPQFNEITDFVANAGCGTDLLTGAYFDSETGRIMPPYFVQYIRIQ